MLRSWRIIGVEQGQVPYFKKRKQQMKVCTLIERFSFLGPNVSPKAMTEMRQALAELCNDGLGKCIDRYYIHSKRLQDGLQNFIGLELFVEQPRYRLPTVVVVKLPHRVNGKSFVKYLADR